MWSWYGEARVCYAYLSDVTLSYEATTSEMEHEPAVTHWSTSTEQQFRASRWFTRGWTLQELLAPRHVRFFDVNWNDLGDKTDLQHEISNITGIERLVLKNRYEIQYTSIAKRMSWAALRSTSREEDQAYVSELINIRAHLRSQSFGVHYVAII